MWIQLLIGREGVGALSRSSLFPEKRQAWMIQSARHGECLSEVCSAEGVSGDLRLVQERGQSARGRLRPEAGQPRHLPGACGNPDPGDGKGEKPNDRLIPPPWTIDPAAGFFR